MPLYTYSCLNTDCDKSGYTLDLLTKFEEQPVCPSCGQYLYRGISAPKGYVKGTTNPVKQ